MCIFFTNCVFRDLHFTNLHSKKAVQLPTNIFAKIQKKITRAASGDMSKHVKYRTLTYLLASEDFNIREFPLQSQKVFS